jgi:hypothetical protein
MARNSHRGGNRSSNRNDEWGVTELVRDRPFAAAAAAAGAAAAGLFLWSRRSQISQQLSELSNQIGEWTDSMRSDSGSSGMDDTAGLTTAGSTGSRSGAGSRSASGTRSGTTSRSGSGSRGRSATGSARGMSETGGGNASLGAHSGGIGTTTTGSPSGRGRADTDNM